MVGELNDFSRGFAEALFRAIPSLERDASVDSNPRADSGSLLVKLTPNPAVPDRLFWVSTHNQEVTVGFGDFHTHLEWPDEYDDPITFIQDLISERTLVRVRMQGPVDYTGWARSHQLHVAKSCRRTATCRASARPNKGMKLTKLVAAPELRAEVPPRASRRFAAARSASQLIPGVGQTSLH